ncbi:MAG: hypothetical protein CM15mP25_4790 [Gammaproteobacteria bacterium]|nr:MAG: hypothetical protein CM15mP25_4790 [Gammaproteobacteria bacterium]
MRLTGRRSWRDGGCGPLRSRDRGGIARGIGYQVAGKTGTSQVVSIAQDAIYDEDAISERNRNHGLFVAFARLKIRAL